MALRTSLAVNITPLLLRIALGAAFVYAGVGKIREAEFSPAEAAMLANAGVSGAINAARNGGPVSVPEAPTRTQPSAPSPTQTEPPTERTAPPTPDSPRTPIPEPEPDAADDNVVGRLGHTVVLVQDAPVARVYTVADFNGPITLPGAHRVTLMLLGATAPDENGKRLLPEQVGEGRWPVALAWAATLTELGGGALIFLGFLSRIWGAALAGVMAVAMWLTTVGPSVMGSDAFLWVLPSTSNFMMWQTFLLQLALMMAALGVLFSGAGAMSLDHYILGGPKDDRPPAPPGPKDSRRP